MTTSSRKALIWRLIALMCNATVGAIWMLIANWIMGFSKSKGWLSSFVEVAVAMNIAVSIRRVAEECIRPAKEFVHRKIDAQIRLHEQEFAKEVFGRLKGLADAAMSKFESDELPRLIWCERIAQPTLVLAILALLGYEENVRWTSLVPALMLPPIWFFVTRHIMVIKALWNFMDELNGLIKSIHDGVK